MLWNLIRDFFVEHIFGGSNSNGDIFGAIVNGESGDTTFDIAFYIPTGSHLDNGELVPTYYTLNLADWLSTTATAISITIIVVLCCLFVYKIIKLIGGLIS